MNEFEKETEKELTLYCSSCIRYKKDKIDCLKCVLGKAIKKLHTSEARADKAEKKLRDLNEKHEALEEKLASIKNYAEMD